MLTISKKMTKKKEHVKNLLIRRAAGYAWRPFNFFSSKRSVVPLLLSLDKVSKACVGHPCESVKRCLLEFFYASTYY